MSIYLERGFYSASKWHSQTILFLHREKASWYSNNWLNRFKSTYSETSYSFKNTHEHFFWWYNYSWFWFFFLYVFFFLFSRDLIKKNFFFYTENRNSQDNLVSGRGPSQVPGMGRNQWVMSRVLVMKAVEAILWCYVRSRGVLPSYALDFKGDLEVIFLLENLGRK